MRNIGSISQLPLVLLEFSPIPTVPPIALQRNWRDVWNQPQMHEYRHGHMSILFSRQLYRDLKAFAEKMRPA